MRVVVLHSHVEQEASKDEADTLVQVETVCSVLGDLSHEPFTVPFTLNIERVVEQLQTIRPDVVFNLVETIQGAGRLIHIAPSILDHLGIAYTGSSTEAVFLTSNKLLAKGTLHRAGIHTPPWFAVQDLLKEPALPGRLYIVKSVWEHASIGLTEDSVLHADESGILLRKMESKRGLLGGCCFAEAFISGREFNLSLLADERGPIVLPPAEIRFDEFPEGKQRIVDYRAKWEEESFEYLSTDRCYDFARKDSPLIHELSEIAMNCWHLFGLKGYARVDFRVDEAGTPWVLEVNTNPCLSPDAGFMAAAQHAGLSFSQVIGRITKDLNCSVPAV
jgi:D-alanine-D-alanine ligase